MVDLDLVEGTLEVDLVGHPVEVVERLVAVADFGNFLLQNPEAIQPRRCYSKDFSGSLS